jgi:hypothetical protein
MPVAVEMLELRKLVDKLEVMGQEVARRENRYADLAGEARDVLASTQVDGELRAKIEQALAVDSSWRGAEPLEDVLDVAHRPLMAPEHATLVAVDGSQIYPDRHGSALYYLINIGSIQLRQGSGQAPITDTLPELCFTEDEIYENGQDLISTDRVNARRDLAEMKALARLTWEEKGQEPERLVVAIKDGQLILWMSEREASSADLKLESDYLEELQAIQHAGGVPVGYVARPRSANVVRLLWVAGLRSEAITKETVREHKYRALTDRTLFTGRLGSNQRSALFVNTSKANRGTFAPAGQAICFFYLNVARPDERLSQIARIDVPQWVAEQPDLLDRAQNAVYADCGGMGFPYVLSRADELAVVSQMEKRDLDALLAVAVAQATGDMPEVSVKAQQKERTRGYVR